MSSYLVKSAKISKNFNLVEVKMPSINEEVKVNVGVNHVFCIDISGSMYGELNKMRYQLKSRLVDLVRKDDTITLIWFNHNSGYITEMSKVTNLNELRDMNKMIDTYLKASGWTNFLDPVELTNKLITRVKSSNKLWNFVFLSDGGHNDCPWDKVVESLEVLADNINSSTIIEYGYYADSNRLQEMAEILGGQKIFDKDFSEYECDFESIMKSNSLTQPRVKFDISSIKSDMKYKFLFTVDSSNRSINVYNVERSNKVTIHPGASGVYYLSKNTTPNDEVSESSKWALVHILASKLKYDLVEEILVNHLSDKDIIDEFVNAYGKQRLEDFKSNVLKLCYGDKFSNIVKSKTKYYPNPKKYCVLDFLNDISVSDSNLIHIFMPEFEYNRTSAKAVNKVVLTQEEREALANSDTVNKANKILDEAKSNQVKMTLPDSTTGYSVKNLVWNNERANISFQVRIPVVLTVPRKDNKGTFEVNSFITRNYTLIKDGILNVSKVPMTLDSKLRGKFKRMGIAQELDNGIILIDLSSMPIINKKSTLSVRAADLARFELDLLESRCKSKYLSYLMNSVTNTKVVEDEYLKSFGITSSGYSPKVELDYSGDHYMANTLVTKIEKFSSIPKIEDIYRKIHNKKSLTVSESYMKSIMDDVDNRINNSSDKSTILPLLVKECRLSKDRCMKFISTMKFSLIMSRRWFADKDGFEDNSVNVMINGNSLNMKFEFVDKKIQL